MGRKFCIFFEHKLSVAFSIMTCALTACDISQAQQKSTVNSVVEESPDASLESLLSDTGGSENSLKPENPREFLMGRWSLSGVECQNGHANLTVHASEAQDLATNAHTFTLNFSRDTQASSWKIRHQNLKNRGNSCEVSGDLILEQLAKKSSGSAWHDLKLKFLPGRVNLTGASMDCPPLQPAGNATWEVPILFQRSGFVIAKNPDTQKTCLEHSSRLEFFSRN